MQPVDHVFILLLFLVQPVYGAFEARRYDARERAGEPFDRILFYRQTAALGVAWYMLGRPISDLGFVTPGGAGFWGGLILLGAMIVYLLYGWRWAARASDTEKTKTVESIGKTIRYLPHTPRELRNFVGISITAGIVEEIVYRGFVLWYLGQVMPLWAAVTVSSVAFGLAHSYQGPSGALRCGLIGLGFAVFYVLTGSIWLPIVAHILLDALQGGAILELLRKRDDGLEPQTV